jgi:hypothetical protein
MGGRQAAEVRQGHPILEIDIGGAHGHSLGEADHLRPILLMEELLDVLIRGRGGCLRQALRMKNAGGHNQNQRECGAGTASSIQ